MGSKNNKKDPLVNFIGIGASRSGTTLIGKCLAEHPEICFSSEKEVGFFIKNRSYQKGIEFYAQYFKHCGNEKIRGEFTPRYLIHPKAAARIHTKFPNAKLIVCLRNPIEATYSQYFFNRAFDKEHAKTFEEALEKYGEETYFSKRKYYTHLSRYLEYFPRDQIFIAIYEDIEKDPYAFMSNIYQFLGADPDFKPQSAEKHVNTSPREKSLVKIPYLNNILTKMRGAPQPIRFFARSKAMRALQKWNKHSAHSKKEPKEPMKPETRERLRKYFSEEITGIESLTGRNLSFWR